MIALDMAMNIKNSFLGWLFSGGLLDNTDGNGLFHVSDGESSQRRIFGESFTAHGFGGFQDDQGRVTILD